MKRGFDWFLLLSLLVIFSFGFSMLFTQEQSLAFQQLKFFLLAILVFFFFSLLDYHFFKHFYAWFYVLSLLLLITTLLLGQSVRGANRWLSLGFFSFQTSEIVKPMLILSLAGFLKNSDKISLFLRNLALFILPVVLIFIQPDLGSALILLLTFGGMLLTSQVPFYLVMLVLLFGGTSLPAGWHFLKDYQKARLLAFLNPQADPLGANYNLIQSIVSVGSGRFLGKGLGFGSQAQLKFLPERHTDFIFATLAEELGFLGSLFFLSVYFFLLLRILKISEIAGEGFAKRTSLGIFFLFFSQFIINVGMNLGLLPITGITLPLVSAGGSSLISSMICLGMVESIVSYSKQRNSFEIR